MTVPSTVRLTNSACNGVTTAFGVGFPFASAADLIVELVDDATQVASPLERGIDYSLTGNPADGTAQIATLAAYPAGKTLRRRRTTTIDQQRGYTPNDGFPAKSHEGALDKLTMISQEIAEDVTRTLKVPPGEAAPTIPGLAARLAAGISLFGILGSGAFGFVPGASFQGPPGNVADLVGTRVAAAAMIVGAQFTALRTTGGQATGDGGGALYRRRSTAPAHPGYFQSADGSYWEIVGPTLPVEAFGAAGDCPDVSGYAPNVQAPIVAAIGAATNDAAAFRAALCTAAAQGGGRVTYGWGKRYRIAFSPAGVWALLLPPNSSIECVGGGELVWDPSLITGVPIAAAPPAGRAYPDHGIGAGDPFTMTMPAVTGAINSAIITAAASAAFTDDSFVRNVALKGVVIRQPVRTYWHALGDVAGVRRLRLFGINIKFATGVVLEDCRVIGTTNNGITGSYVRNLWWNRCRATRCGFGAPVQSSSNGFTIAGGMFVGKPDYDGANIYLTNCTAEFNRDEGLAYGVIRDGFFTSFAARGNHDSGVEGDFSYRTIETGASLGYDIPGDVAFIGLQVAGKDVLPGTASIAAGSDQLAMDDAFYATVAASGTNLITIPGAGAAGADLFAITAADYAANVVTVTPAATNAVAAVKCFTMSRQVINSNEGNEGRAIVQGVKARDIHGRVNPIGFLRTSGGNVRVSGVEYENVYLPNSYYGVYISADVAMVDNVNSVGGSGDETTALVGGIGRKLFWAKDVHSDGGYGGALRAIVGAGGTLRVENVGSDSCSAGDIRFQTIGKAARIDIDRCISLGANGSAQGNQGWLTMDSPAGAASAAKMVIKGNRVRMAGRTPRPIVALAALAAGSFDEVVCEDNEIAPDNLTFPVPASVPYAVSFDNSGGAFTIFRDRRNGFYGQRLQSLAAIPTTGVWANGDAVENSAPAAGGFDRARCILPGALGALGGVTGALPAYSTQLTVNDASGIPAQAWLTVGTYTGRVLYATGNVLTMASANGAAAVAAGSAVAFRAATFQQTVLA